MTIGTGDDILADDILAIKTTADAAAASLASLFSSTHTWSAPQTFTNDITGTTAAADTNSVIMASTAFVIGQAGAATPLIAGTAAPGTSLRYARQDHVHPTDTTRYAASNPTGYQTAAQVSSAITAAAYSLPTASTTVLGGVKIDGTTVTIAAGVLSAAVASVAGRTGAVTIAVADVSGAAPLASPTLTGTPAAPTAAGGTNTTQIATTAFVTAAISTGAYTLPTATTTVLGGVKPDNVTITNTAGAISVAYGTAANTAAQGNDSRFAAGLHRLFITGTSVGNGADLTEDTLQSFTIPANTLANVGDTIHIYAAGTLGATTDSKTPRIKVGGTNLVVATTAASTLTKWYASVIIMKTGTNTQTYMTTTSGNTAVLAGITNGTLTLTDSATIALLVTGQNTTNSVAGSVTCQMLVVNFER